MKKLFLGIAALLAQQTCFATIFEMDPRQIFAEPQIYGKNTELGFELINKSPNDIWVSFINGKDVLTNPLTGQHFFYVEGMGKDRTTVRFGLDIYSPTKLAIWFRNPKQVEVTGSKLLGLAGEFKFVPEPDLQYTFKTGKTLYLTLDPKGFIRPQTGPLKGLLKKTDSNLSLVRNVSVDDIKKVDTQKK